MPGDMAARDRIPAVAGLLAQLLFARGAIAAVPEPLATSRTSRNRLPKSKIASAMNVQRPFCASRTISGINLPKNPSNAFNPCSL